MLDNLIRAYRAQIYDWDLSKWIDLCKEKPKLAAGAGAFIALVVISIITYIRTNSSLLLLIILLGEGISIIFMDRHVVKKYRIFLLSRQNHLNKTVSFLETALPEKDLFNVGQIEELIARLTEHIESSIPFSRFLSGFNSFAKGIILPVITYIAGMYAGNLGHLDIEIVIRWSVAIVLLLGIARFTWEGVFIILRTVTCRQYDAAIAFREDLMDIKLLYFSESKDVG